jgi:hypothetical protein
MPDTVPAMLEPGEFVIRKDAAEKIGMDKLNMLNNADRLENGNSAIDELIALSTLSGSQQMMGGGDVKKMPQSGYMQEGGMAYIDPSDSTIVTKNSEQSELFDMLKNSISFAPETTNKYALETFIDMLNNPNSYNRLDKDKDKTPIRALPPEKVKFDDPLEIDMRMRSNNVQAIGVARPRPDSEENILRDLAKMQRDIKLLQFVKPRYPKSSSFNEYRRMKEESGDMMSMEEMMEVLNRAASATQNKFKVKGYDNGGQVYSYGSGETSVPTLADLYEKMGVQPIEGQQRERFESLFTYDPSREETIVDEFQSGVESLREGAGRQLGQARMASEASGAGFAGFGERDRMMSDLSMNIENKATRGLESARRGLFEDISAQRDRYMSEAIAGLSELEGAEGTREYSPSSMGVSGLNPSFQPPSYTPSNTMMPVTVMGTDGKMYTWSPESQSWQLQQ